MDNEDDRPYEVGYKKPPIASRFPKGRSGNPKGRPRGSKNVRDVFEREMSRRLVGRVNGRRTSMTSLQAIVKQLFHRSVAGDLKATKLLLDCLKSLPNPPTGPGIAKIVFAKEDEKI